MGAFCDLHLHSCLSPCAEDDMTPWNMVGMAKIKGLDVIAITDHNAVLNAEDAMAAGREYGVEVIPGMEITSREEVHMLAYRQDSRLLCIPQPLGIPAGTASDPEHRSSRCCPG